jgi:hypothetical protein
VNEYVEPILEIAYNRILAMSADIKLPMKELLQLVTKGKTQKVANDVIRFLDVGITKLKSPLYNENSSVPLTVESYNANNNNTSERNQESVNEYVELILEFTVIYVFYVVVSIRLF